MVVDAVNSEPLSEPNSLFYRENTGKYLILGLKWWSPVSAKQQKRWVLN